MALEPGAGTYKVHRIFMTRHHKYPQTPAAQIYGITLKNIHSFDMIKQFYEYG